MAPSMDDTDGTVSSSQKSLKDSAALPPQVLPAPLKAGWEPPLNRRKMSLGDGAVVTLEGRAALVRGVTEPVETVMVRE